MENALELVVSMAFIAMTVQLTAASITAITHGIVSLTRSATFEGRKNYEHIANMYALYQIWRSCFLSLYISARIIHI